MSACPAPFFFGHRYCSDRMQRERMNDRFWLVKLAVLVVLFWPLPCGAGEEGPIILLEPVEVNGLAINRDQQVGPVPKHTPWPTIPSSLEGEELDDWLKARLLVSKEAKVTVVVLESARRQELTVAGLSALQQWTFNPQMKGDEPVDGEVTVRIHFRTQ